MTRTARPANIVVVSNDLGPAMLELPDIEQQFVVALIQNGGNQTRAALAAGYGTTSNAGSTDQIARNAGWRLAHRPRVIAAIREQAEKMLQAGVIRAGQILNDLMENGDPKVAMKAAEAVLDRGGMQIVHKQQIEVTDNRTATELMAFIREAAAEQGLDPKKLLGQAGVGAEIIDAEFTEVLVASSEGLEDLL